METPNPPATLEQKIDELLKTTKSVQRYLRWQIYITIALVVLPLLAVSFLFPFILNTLTGSAGINDILTNFPR